MKQFIQTRLIAPIMVLSLMAFPCAAVAQESSQTLSSEKDTSEIMLVSDEEASSQSAETASSASASDDADTEASTQSDDTEASSNNATSVEHPESGSTDTAQIGTEAAAPTITGRSHVQNIGWSNATQSSDGLLTLGTTGQALRVEGIALSVSSGSISYRTHVQNEGWQDWRSDGAEAGSTGKAQRLEAIRIKLSDELVAEGWSVRYRVHVQDFGWLGWSADGAVAGTSGMAKRMECVEVKIVKSTEGMPDAGAAYRDSGLSCSAHVQNIGWQGTQHGYNVTLGTSGRGLRMEALKISRPALDCTGDIVYSAHVQNIGWQGERRNGEIAGTSGRALRVEALKLYLTGELAENYDIWYRSHVQNVGWMDWATDGEASGSEGLGLRVEAIQIAMVEKGAGAPAVNNQNYSLSFISSSTLGTMGYRVLQGGAWSDWATNGATAGSEGDAAVKGITAHIDGGIPGQVSYAVHLADIGWCPEVSSDDDAMQSDKDVQAIRMRLSGEIASASNIWYRAYVKGVGWTYWAHNGEDCGSVGQNRPIVALQVQLRSTAVAGPNNTGAAIYGTCATQGFPQSLSQANATQRRIVQAANSTPWPGVGLCAGWVENVYRNAGLGEYSGNACDLYDWYCHSSSMNNLKVGMIVAVRTHTRTSAGSIWGHVGIYVGDGKVMHSVTSGVKTVDLQYWVNFYGTTYTPKWGWLGNVNVA